jgi:mannosyltransferase OCH1-like enzyme
VVALCVENWKRFASDHHIHLLHAGNLHEYIGDTPLPANFNQMPEYRRADWLRSVLLSLHGGIWLDASLILTGPLDWVHSEQQAYASEFVGFYIDWMTEDPKRPIVENWFMAAPQGSCFVVDWLEELEGAIVDEAAYLERLQREGLYNLAVQGMTGPSYLIMHVAVSLLQAKNPGRYRLVLHKAEDSAFFHLSRLGWTKKRLYVRLGFSPCPQRLPAIIKLRGTERRIFERYLKRGWVLGRSAVGRYLLSSERPAVLDLQTKPEAEH